MASTTPARYLKQFNAAGDALAAQFSSYEPFPGVHVNGKLTLGENIADLGGLATAYDALQKATAGKEDPKVDGFTRDQRFFFNWATVWRTKYTPENAKVRLATDPHAPAQFRAMGAPSNLPTFVAAFQCKAGSPVARAGEQQVVICARALNPSRIRSTCPTSVRLPSPWASAWRPWSRPTMRLPPPRRRPPAPRLSVPSAATSTTPPTQAG
ncbi:hypothetical protein G6F31_016476 [Rhizopus arrhizus]|nr:hypothetical protein G6F31_016476 [Rhizopus arrhizus]